MWECSRTALLGHAVHLWLIHVRKKYNMVPFWRKKQKRKGFPFLFRCAKVLVNVGFNKIPLCRRLAEPTRAFSEGLTRRDIAKAKPSARAWAERWSAAIRRRTPLAASRALRGFQPPPNFKRVMRAACSAAERHCEGSGASRRGGAPYFPARFMEFARRAQARGRHFLTRSRAERRQGKFGTLAAGVKGCRGKGRKPPECLTAGAGSALSTLLDNIETTLIWNRLKHNSFFPVLMPFLVTFYL